MSDGSDSEFLEEMLGGGKKPKSSAKVEKKRKRVKTKRDPGDSDSSLSSFSSASSAPSSASSGDSASDSDAEVRQLRETVKKYDKDGYLDDADRKALARMSEMDRERILAERIEKVKDRSSPVGRVGGIVSLMWLERSDRDKGSRKTEDAKKGKRKRHGDDEVRKQDAEAERERDRLAREDEETKRREEITYDLMRSVQVTREELAKWDYFAHQESTLVGAYVRVFIGPHPLNRSAVYRLCLIESLIEINPNQQPYVIERTKPQIVTRHALKVLHGKASKVFNFDLISNSNHSMDEFRRWQQALTTDKAEWPSKHELQLKANQLAAIRERKTTQAEFDEMIKNKLSLQKGPRNLGAEKARLLNALNVAQDAGELERVAEIKEELAKLDEKSQSKAATLKDWSIINERNRKKEMEQLKAAAMIERQKKHGIKAESKTDENGVKLEDVMDLDGGAVLDLPMDSYPGKSRFEVALAQYPIVL
ncbi:hypothetical protein HDU93_009934 [Gonapodya sp. JEL0774]|nr:hypothetical protein HDU93_009934 [Gonapodya sp. JEL0774]